MNQPCGHSIAHRKPLQNGGTWCDACLPDDTVETYVRMNLHEFVTKGELYAVAGPPFPSGQIPCVSFRERAEAVAFARTIPTQVWIVGPDGEFIDQEDSQ